MNVKWTIGYFSLALDCSWPIIQSLANAPLLLVGDNVCAIEDVRQYFVERTLHHLGSFEPEFTFVETTEDEEIWKFFTPSGRRLEFHGMVYLLCGSGRFMVSTDCLLGDNDRRTIAKTFWIFPSLFFWREQIDTALRELGQVN